MLSAWNVSPVSGTRCHQYTIASWAPGAHPATAVYGTVVSAPTATSRHCSGSTQGAQLIRAAVSRSTAKKYAGAPELLTIRRPVGATETSSVPPTATGELHASAARTAKYRCMVTVDDAPRARFVTRCRARAARAG